MELTINNLIKMVIAGVVIVIVILGIYFGMRNYVIPYFSGIGFGGEDDIGEIVGEAGVCEGKTPIGILDKRKSKGGFTESFFIYNGKKTNIYFSKEGYVKINNWGREDTAGRVNGYEIEIDDKYKKGDAKVLDGALIGGNQICEP